MIKYGLEVVPSPDYLMYGGDMKFPRLTQAEIEEIRKFNEELANKILWI